jgi:hypothetical protein
MKELSTKAKAKMAVAAMRIDITKEQPERFKGTITVGELARHYQNTELNEESSTRAFSTRECDRGMIHSTS